MDETVLIINRSFCELLQGHSFELLLFFLNSMSYNLWNNHPEYKFILNVFSESTQFLDSIIIVFKYERVSFV